MSSLLNLAMAYILMIGGYITLYLIDEPFLSLILFGFALVIFILLTLDRFTE